MKNFEEKIKENGLTVEQYEECLHDLRMKVNRLTDIDWQEIIDKYNLSMHYDTLRKASQTIFGGAFVMEYFKYQNENVDKPNEYIEELRKERQELQKERYKLFDERRELNKKLREQARKERFIEMVGEVISRVEPLSIEYEPKEYTDESNDLICHLTDIHAGLNINNWFNKFNMNILRKRLNQYLDEVFEIQKTHNSGSCYLVIGEIISGLIHETLRIENNENVMEQFMMVASLISDMILELAKKFCVVSVYITPGNHSRVVANKNLSIKGENFDILLPFYLKARLQNANNVFIEDNIVDSDVAMFAIRNTNVFAVHGDKDKPNEVVKDFSMMFGIKPDIVLLGHRHTNGYSTVYDSKVIQSGCVSGTDDYATSLRLRNKPELTVSVVGDKGLRCVYDVRLD